MYLFASFYHVPFHSVEVLLWWLQVCEANKVIYWFDVFVYIYIHIYLQLCVANIYLRRPHLDGSFWKDFLKFWQKLNEVYASLNLFNDFLIKWPAWRSQIALANKLLISTIWKNWKFNGNKRFKNRKINGKNKLKKLE